MVKYRAMALLLALALLTPVFMVGNNNAMAAAGDPTARKTAILVAITYMNTGTSDAKPTFNFYPEKIGTAIPFTPKDTAGADLVLKPGASSSLAVSSVTGVADQANFKGSAVLTADQPMAATIVQIPQGQNATAPLVKNRPLANGFEASQAAAKYLIPTVLNAKFSNTTVFSVQNAEATNAVDISIQFIDETGAVAKTVPYTGIPAGAAVYVEADDANIGLPAAFNGAAIITAKVGSADGKIIAIANEMRIDEVNGDIKSFEGVSKGADTVYIPYAMCKAFTGNTTAYAVQNSGAAAAHVTVTYVGGTANGKTPVDPISTSEITIAPGQKASFVGCTGSMNGVLPDTFNGAATVKARTGEEIVVVGKVTGAGMSTGALGDSSGAAKIALPYVRYTPDPYFVDAAKEQRTNIAIQNISGKEIPANQITVKFINANGETVGSVYTHATALADGAKFSISPAANTTLGWTGALDSLGRFGAYGAAVGQGPYGGGAIVACAMTDCKLSAAGRVESTYAAGVAGVKVAEDYNGIPME